MSAPAFLGRVWLHPFLRKHAAHIAAARTARNAALNGNPAYDRGADSLRVDSIGALGELAVRFWCDITGQRYTAAPLLAPFPVADCDLVLDGKRYDVKATTAADKVYVNAAAHHKKVCDGYLFVWLKEREALIYRTDYAAVSGWEQKRLRYTDALCCPAALPDLCRLEETR